MTRCVLLAVCLLGCGDPARDYSYPVGCPAEPSPNTFRHTVCDRGVGYTPRFVQVTDCAAEAGNPVPPGASFGIASSTHPAFWRCAAQVNIFTYDDVAEHLQISR